MTPKPIEDERGRDLCAVCDRDLGETELGPRLFWSSNGMVTRYAHAGCIDWTERPSPARDLIKRIRSARRQAGELERLLGILRLASVAREQWKLPPRPPSKRECELFAAGVAHASGGVVGIDDADAVPHIIAYDRRVAAYRASQRFGR